MSDILLATSFFLKNDAKQIEKMRPYAPLGTLQVAAALQQRGYTVAIFDAMLADSEDEYHALLEKEQPEIVALYEDEFNFLNKMCLTHSREASFRMAEAARKVGATVVAAGADVSDDPAVYLDHGVSYALYGEADETLCELVETLSGQRDGDPKDIPGLVMRGDGGDGALHRSERRRPQKQADRFPMAAWEHLDAERYRTAWLDAHGYYSVNMVTTRGCPFHCNWCAKPIWGQHYAMRSPAAVAEELAHLKTTVRPDHIWFADDIFGLQPRWVAEFASEVEARDASVPFMIQTRVDLMTDRAVAGLARAGCAEVWLGVESGSQKILDAMDKGTKVADIPVVREKLRQAGIKACFFLQFGYPGETFEDIMMTVRLVRDLLPDDIGISTSYPLPGTKFYDRVKQELGSKEHWDNSDELAMMFHGPYRTPFYRTLRDLLHRDLVLRQKTAGRQTLEPDLHMELGRLETDWRRWRDSEPTFRNAEATVFTRPQAPAEPLAINDITY